MEIYHNPLKYILKGFNNFDDIEDLQYLSLNILAAGLWLAEELGMNKNIVSKWCRNEMQPTEETLLSIADTLDVDERELLVSNKGE